MLAEKFNRLLCIIFGHKWKYCTYHTLKFGSHDYAECSRCNEEDWFEWLSY